MKITFIGTGSIAPDPKIKGKPYRSCAAVYVEVGKDSILFDIGPGTLTKLQQIGIDTRIHPKHLFITHYHIDHCQDYIALIKSRWFDAKTGAIEPQEKVHVYGPTDLITWTKDLFSGVKRWDYMSSMLDYKKVSSLHEVTTSEVKKTKNWRVSCAPVEHYDGVAFRLDAEGKSFVYSGDMVYDENLSKLGKHADIVAIECSFPDKKSLLGKHLCPEDIGKLARLGKFKHTILTHMYPACLGKERQMKKTITSLAATKVTVAHDFFSLTL